jgi:hypothetical protein
MRSRCFASTTLLAAATLMIAGSANASHLGYPSAHLLAGRVVYYSIDFQAILNKLTGKDLKVGTDLFLRVDILGSNVACANPQSKAVMPGTGPKGRAFGSDEVSADDQVDKGDRTGATFVTNVAAVDLVPAEMRLAPPEGLCKATKGTEWQVVFWQDRGCSKGLPWDQLTNPICYDYRRFGLYDLGPNLAGQITLLSTGEVIDFKDRPSERDNWVWVYLPTQFVFKADLKIDTYAETLYGHCAFPPNNEPGANKPGEPYGINNPPEADGVTASWAAFPPVEYGCSLLKLEEWEQFISP